ncbi:MAG: heme biosynthesis HemY N-terminal domain-containing protein, partial [Deltaproteobacteria bacterium]
MFVSLVRISVFIALIAGLSFSAVYLADNGGTVRVIIAETEFNPGPVQLMIAVGALLVAIWLFFRVLGLVFATIRFVTGDETAISRYFNRNRERKGFEALADSLIALASGDARGAYKSSARAEKLLGRPELTDLITAQAAERAGETARATASYKRLLGHSATRFAAVRGLLGQRLAAGDVDQALKLAEKAIEMKPANGEVQD